MGSKYSYDKDFFETIDNQEKAYWLGFLYADGSITRFYRNEKLKSMSLELTLKESDEGHLFRFLSDLNSNVPIQTRKHSIQNKEYISKRVVINNTKMCRDLIKLGCTPQKSLTLEFPSSDIVSEDFLLSFIRGYFDGDGCVHYSEGMYYHKNKGKEYSQKSFVVSIVGTYEFLNSLKKILHNNNINSNEIKSGNTGKAYELRLTDRHNIKNFYDLIYKNTNTYLKRKKEIFEYAFEKFNINT